MKIRLHILVREEEYEDALYFIADDEKIDLFVSAYGGEKVEDVIKNKDALDYFIEVKRDLAEEDNRSLCEEDENAINYIYSHFDDLLEESEYVVLPFLDEDNLEYIKENPFLQNKKIVLDEMVDMTDFDRVIELMDIYKDIKDKIYITVDGNSEYTKLTDCYKTIEEIRKTAESIKELNLSPMETIMYTYDIVRNREYNEEDENENYTKSRDLTEVMFGDKIVCLGFANYFNAILNCIGIKSNVVILGDSSGQRGHARSVIYVKDSKYNIDGVYYFDPTFDSKKNDNNDYLYTYKFFAKTRNYMDKINDKHHLTDELSKDYSDDIFVKTENIVSSSKYSELLPFYRTVNYMGNIVGEKMLLLSTTLHQNTPWYGNFNTKEFLDKFEDVCDKFNRPLPAETMLELFNNVRKIEFYQNPEWFPYDVNTIYRVYMNSDWKYNNSRVSDEEKLYMTLFGSERELRKKEFISNMYEADVLKDIAGVRMAKVLQKVVQKKQNENLQ